MTHVQHAPVVGTAIAHRLDAAAWGLVFLWVGVALLAGIGWGLGLLGVGVIALVGQLARRYSRLAVEPFWVLVGLCLALGGVWEILGLRFSLIPVLLILAGMALLVSALRSRPPIG